MRKLCALIVRGLDQTPSDLPAEFVRECQGRANALELAGEIAKTPNEIFHLRGYGDHEYQGSYKGDGVYELKGYHHQIRLTEPQVRQVHVGTLERVPVDFKWDQVD